MVLWMISGWFYQRLSSVVRDSLIFGRAQAFQTDAMTQSLREVSGTALLTVMPLFLVLIISGLAGHFLISGNEPRLAVCLECMNAGLFDEAAEQPFPAPAEIMGAVCGNVDHVCFPLERKTETPFQLMFGHSLVICKMKIALVSPS